jgi:Mn-dependent DtxR family transcriptional regulator
MDNLPSEECNTILKLIKSRQPINISGISLLLNLTEDRVESYIAHLKSKNYVNIAGSIANNDEQIYISHDGRDYLYSLLEKLRIDKRTRIWLIADGAIAFTAIIISVIALLAK